MSRSTANGGAPDVSKQCGKGYRGPSCESCAALHWTHPITGACMSCLIAQEGGGGGAGDQSQSLLGALVPLMWLLGALLIAFIVIGAAIFHIQRKNGGYVHPPASTRVMIESPLEYYWYYW